MSLPLPPDPFAESYRSGTSYALAIRFSPEEYRGILAFLFALKLNLDRLLESHTEPEVLKIKALWWEEELARASRGEARHPLTLRAHSLGFLERPGVESLGRFAAGYAACLGTAEQGPDQFFARARSCGGMLLERVSRVLGEERAPGLETARRAGTAHEAVALLLHDRKTRERFPPSSGEREHLISQIRSDLEALPRLGEALVASPSQRVTRILLALTQARLRHGEPGPFHKMFLAWWYARHEQHD